MGAGRGEGDSAFGDTARGAGRCGGAELGLESSAALAVDVVGDAPERGEGGAAGCGSGGVGVALLVTARGDGRRTAAGSLSRGGDTGGRSERGGELEAATGGRGRTAASCAPPDIKNQSAPETSNPAPAAIASHGVRLSGTRAVALGECVRLSGSTVSAASPRGSAPGSCCGACGPVVRAGARG